MKIYLRGRVWWVRYSFNSKRYHYSLGVTERAEAEEEFARIKYELRHGNHRPKMRMIFDNLLAEYLEWAKNNKEESSYKRDLTSSKLLLAKFGHKRIDKLTLKRGEEYQIERLDGKLRVDESRKPKVSKATVNRETCLLKHMFKKAVRWGYLDQNPFQYLEMQKEPPHRTRYVTSDEWPRLLSACSVEMRVIVVFARLTGMRLGEILNLKWEDIDWHRDSITIVKCKNNTPRTIPMTSTLRTVLLRRYEKANSSYVFPGENGKRTTIRTGFNAACRRASIKNLRFHDLRHTFASDLVNKGIDLLTIMKLMGHKSISSTMRYAHLQEKRLREAMEQTSEHFPDETGPKVAQEGNEGE